MVGKSIKSLVTREIILVAIFLTLAMTIITALWQLQWEGQSSQVTLSEFESILRKDQDTLLLQVLLGKASDLNLYFENMKIKFPRLRFCLDLNPAVSDIKDLCQDSHTPNQKLYALLGNRNHVIRFGSLAKPATQILSDLLTIPLFYTTLLTSVFLALFLHFRLSSLLTRPLIQVRQAIMEIVKGHRNLPLNKIRSVNEWHEIELSLQTLTNYIVRLEKAENEAGQVKVARQVAHDIRSPLSMLRIGAQVFTDLPLDKRDLLLMAVNRIEEIIDSLGRRHNETRAQDRQMAYPLVQAVICEKRLELTKKPKVKLQLEAEALAKRCYMKIEPGAFKRILSNLINNAVEAIEQNGIVRVSISAGVDEVYIRILDTGRGIPQNLIHHVQSGVSIGKSGGQGLGLSHAQNTIEGWQGRIVVDSAESLGTAITIIMPAEFEPDGMIKKQPSVIRL